MSHFQSNGIRHRRGLRLLTSFILCGLIGAYAVSPLASSAAAALHAIDYRGYVVQVPASWPVYDLSTDPTHCVRFDQHAVYLGQPGADEQCPAHAVGRTEALWIQPLTAPVAQPGVTMLGPGQVDPSGWPALSSQQAVFAVSSAGVLVMATWNTNASLMEQIVRGARLSGTPSSASSGTAGPAAATGARSGSGSATVPASTYTGLGFDTCAAPSSSTMSAWLSSPYRGIGIYIGGVNRACAQPNLSSGWVSGETAAGWQLLPIYVGLQAPVNGCGCSAINPSQAAQQGTAAADDAVAQATTLGIAAGSPIYFDMENYATGSTNSPAVLSFLAAWTARLHGDGYVSGVYSSGSSGISDLVSQYGSSTYAEPDDIWIADWNGQQTVSDPYVPSNEWANHQRVHQYQGGHNESYGGVTLNIDNDYLDGAVAGTQEPVQTVDTALLPGSTGGYALTSDGNITAFGGAPGATPSATWTWSIARRLVVLPNGSGGYVLDGWGGIHPFAIGSNPMPPATAGGPYWPGWDIARGIVLTPNGTGGYVLDGWGGMHPFAVGSNPAPAGESGGPYWNGWDIARGIVLNSGGTGGYILDGYGVVHPFSIGSNPMPPAITTGPSWNGWDIARDIVLDFTDTSGYVLDGWGGVHPFAASGTPLPPAATSPDYNAGHDTARGLALYQVRSSAAESGGTVAWVPGGVAGEYVTTDRTSPHPYYAVAAARAVVALPGHAGAGYVLTGDGNLTAFGGAPAATPSGTWTWDIARAAVVLPNGTGGYVLDGWGGVHPFAIGSNPMPPATSGGAYWPGWDIARGIVLTPKGTGGYIMDGWGGTHPFAIGSNPVPPAVTNGPYWNGWDIARGIVLMPRGAGGYILDGYGAVHPFAIGSNPLPPATTGGPSWNGWDIARGVVLTPKGTGGYVLDGWGGVHPFAIGSNPVPKSLAVSGYYPGWDVVTGLAATTTSPLQVTTVDSHGGLHTAS